MENQAKDKLIYNNDDIKVKNRDRYIDRPFNVRPICFWAFFVGLTLIVCNWSYNAGAVWMIGVYFAVLICVFFGLQFLNTKDKVLLFLGSSRLFFCGLVVLCLLAALSYALMALSYTSQKSYAGYSELCGVVENYVVKDDGSGYFVLSEVKFDGDAVSGKVIVYAQDFSPEFVTFDIISVETRLQKVRANDYYVNNGIKYTANIKAKDIISVIGEDGSVRSVVLKYSHGLLEKGLDEENADLMYSMVFGDKSGLDGEMQESFRLTGLAHVLAVSGMNVALIVGLLVLILNTLYVSKKRQLYIIFCVLLFYCYLCGFQYSIMRASIMFFVFCVRRAYLRNTDFLSSLCLAGILILLLFPYSIYSVSFQLSFACMFGIGLFFLPIKEFLESRLSNDTRWSEQTHASWRMRETKAFITKWMSMGVAMYVCTTIACLPFMIKYFGMVSIAGLLANVLLLPFISLAFQVCVVVLVAWVAFPVLYLLNPIVDVTLAVVRWIADLPFSNLYISGGGGDALLLYLIGIVFMTRFVFLRRKVKYSVATVFVAAYALFVVFF